MKANSIYQLQHSKFFGCFILSVLAACSSGESANVATANDKPTVEKAYWEKIGSSVSISGDAENKTSKTKSLVVDKGISAKNFGGVGSNYPDIPAEKIVSPGDTYKAASISPIVQYINPAYIAFPFKYVVGERDLTNEVSGGTAFYLVKFTNENAPTKGNSMPYKLKRTLTWVEDNVIDDRPVFLYPGYNYSYGLSVTNGVSDTVADRWLNQVDVGVSVTAGFKTAVSWFGLVKAEASISGTVSTGYTHQWEGSTSRTINKATTETRNYSFVAPADINTMRQFSYWKLLESWEIVKNKPGQSDDGASLTSDELTNDIWNVLANASTTGIDPTTKGQICHKQKTKDITTATLDRSMECEVKEFAYNIDLQAAYNNSSSIRWGTPPTGFDPLKQIQVTTLDPVTNSLIIKNVVHTIDWKRNRPAQQ